MRNYEDDAPKGLGVDMFALAMDKANRRLFIACILLIVALISTNLAWTIYCNQFATEVVTIEADQEADVFGRNLIVGGDYGDEAKSQSD